MGATGPLADRGDLQAPRTAPPANAIAAVSLRTRGGGDDRDEATEAQGRPHITAQRKEVGGPERPVVVPIDQLGWVILLSSTATAPAPGAGPMASGGL